MDPDFNVTDHGSVVVLTPISEAADIWAAEHLPIDAMTWGRNGVVVERRFIVDILAGIQDDGLTFTTF